MHLFTFTQLFLIYFKKEYKIDHFCSNILVESAVVASDGCHDRSAEQF